MAKLIGPIGSKMRGKVGQIVAAKTVGGDTAIRSYQPQVKNPNTLRQRVSRNKMAKASELAATFSEVIKIGYAKAVAGAKMYARNMFVRNVIPVGAGALTVNGETVTVDETKLRFSEAVGIGIMPSGSWAENAGSTAMVYSVDNASRVTLPAGSTLGIVVTVVSEDLKQSYVYVGTADEGVEVPMENIGGLGNVKFAAFYKEIPEAVNGVSSENIPWKYPSLTGPSTVLAALQ